MDRAREIANTRRRRKKGVAEDAWLRRLPITSEEGAASAETLARETLAALEERGLTPGQKHPVLKRRAVERDATRRALVAHGILHFKRRSQHANVNLRSPCPGCPVPDVDLRHSRFGPGAKPAL